MKIILKSVKPKFVLRHITLNDLDEYLRISLDSAVKKGILKVPKTKAEARKEINEIMTSYREKKPKDEDFAIDVDGKFIGLVSIHGLSYGYEKHKGVLGYWIAKEYRGKGIATMAVKMVTKYAFKKYKLIRITGFCRTFNKASARVLEKAGYKCEGILRKNKFKDGKYLHDMLFAKVK
ncbi:GNAT family N-acetyltransferase [Candidatus Pacearchaeota archaeon]|nr:GNAT family N-acetyltransferase [Candidatus Pacearchaeota archaeon]